MKRKFKPVNNFTNITSHLHPLNAKKKETMTYGIGNPCPDLGQVQNVTGSNRLM
jgi:hypothetical protein